MYKEYKGIQTVEKGIGTRYKMQVYVVSTSTGFNTWIIPFTAAIMVRDVIC
jgi:hypothetical protein